MRAILCLILFASVSSACERVTYVQYVVPAPPQIQVQTPEDSAFQSVPMATAPMAMTCVNGVCTPMSAGMVTRAPVMTTRTITVNGNGNGNGYYLTNRRARVVNRRAALSRGGCASCQ